MAMEDFRVDVIVGKGPGATAIPLEIPPFTVVGATTRAGLLPEPAARPVRLHRPARLLRRPTSCTASSTARPACSTRGHRPTAAARSPRDRAARRASPTGCSAGCATSPRCAPTAPSTSTTAAAGAGAVRGRRPRARPPRPRRAVRRCAGASAAARSASRRSPSPSARSARRSRSSPSRSSCGWASWPARRAAAWPPRRPGATSACTAARTSGQLPFDESGRRRAEALHFRWVGWLDYAGGPRADPSSLGAISNAFGSTHRVQLGPVPAPDPHRLRLLVAGPASGTQPAEGVHGDAERPDVRLAGHARQRHLRRAGRGRATTRSSIRVAPDVVLTVARQAVAKVIVPQDAAAGDEPTDPPRTAD